MKYKSNVLFLRETYIQKIDLFSACLRLRQKNNEPLFLIPPIRC